MKLISLEDAIRKMTSLPAQTFGFRDRGLIREGFAADIAIFDENTIIDQATFDKPHQFPLGISYVFVNGASVLENNQMTEARPGVALRGPGYLSTGTAGGSPAHEREARVRDSHLRCSCAGEPPAVPVKSFYQ
jgi:N-acyl-D-aspartate/D-glutamate deacylase